MLKRENEFVINSILIYIVPALIVGYIVEMVLGNSFITSVTLEVSFIISFFIIRKSYLSDFSLPIKNHKIRIAPAILVSLSSIFYSIFLIAIMMLIFPFEITPNNFNVEFFIGISFTFILNPIMEELIFRKYVCTVLYLKYSFPKTVVISSLIFTIVHLGNPFSMLQTIIGSIFIYFLFLKTKKIIDPILFHILHNSIYGLITLTDEVEFLSSGIVLWGSLIGTLIFTVSTIIIVNRNKAEESYKIVIENENY
jgi:membrane protease YdiL (CAAX protease family)